MSAEYWSRTHKNGVVATVSPLRPPRVGYLAGAPRLGAASPYAEIQTLFDARLHADMVSGCVQPCDCPEWASRREPDTRP